MAGFVKLLVSCILENLAGGGGGVEGRWAFVKKLEDVWNHGGNGYGINGISGISRIYRTIF